jgi:aspartate kinase
MKNLTVMKFGGSCLQNKDSFVRITKIVNKYKEGSKLVLITSALNGITDKLLEFYKASCDETKASDNIIETISNIHEQLIFQLIKENSVEHLQTFDFLKKIIKEITQLGNIIRLIRPNMDIRDLIISYGEKLSTFILTQFLKSIDVASEFVSSFVSSSDILLTDDNFGNALPLLEETEVLVQGKLIPLLNADVNKLICVTGFYGSTKDKKITTFGRGGSDLTASLIAYSLRNNFDCNVIYWKDVKGFLNADPKFVKKASLLKYISYVEAKELTFFGAKILHPLCLDLSEKGDFPSKIKFFDDPYLDDYTTITKEIVRDAKIIKAVTSIYRLSMVTIEGDTMIPLPGTASKLFSLLDHNNINLVFISQSSSENNITFGIDFEDSMKVSTLLRNSELFGKKWFSIKIDNEISLVAIIGAGVLETPGIAGKVFTKLGDNNINIKAIAQGSSELSFTAIIERKDCVKAVNILYDTFIA